MLTKAQAHKIALSFEGAAEGLNFGKPTILVAGKFFGRVDHKEEAMELAVASMEMRDVMLEAEPELFYITSHHKNFPYLLARLSKLDKATLEELLNARLLQIEAKTKKKRAEPKSAKVPAKRKAKKNKS